MRKISVFIFLLVFWVGISGAGYKTGAGQNCLTTIILVRHAEKVKDGSRDADLTSEGIDRAAELAYVLKHIEFAAVYSTPFKRTRKTAFPTARAKGLKIKLYDPGNPEFLKQVLKIHSGESVLIVGHSNTIPALANELIGQEFYSALDDSIYDNLFIASVPGEGKAVVVRIRFGKHTPDVK